MKNILIKYQYNTATCVTTLFVLASSNSIFSTVKECKAPLYFLVQCICIGNSMVSRGIWDKYRERYFKIHQNITSREAASDIWWGVLKYHEPVFIPNIP